jgi:hypothetical protein
LVRCRSHFCHLKLLNCFVPCWNLPRTKNSLRTKTSLFELCYLRPGLVVSSPPASEDIGAMGREIESRQGVDGLRFENNMFYEMSFSTCQLRQIANTTYTYVHTYIHT